VSDKAFWRSRLDYDRRTQASIDTATRLPTSAVEKVLADEPCDLRITTRRVSQQGPNGTAYNTVKVTQLRLYPDDPTLVPDENDSVTVDGVTYKVLSSRPNHDAADGRYMGSILDVRAVRETDARPG
jgi:hypothetical protein